MSQPTLYESGLQPERTALAWRRTTLSLLVGSVVSIRLLGDAIGGWSIAVGSVGLVVTGLVWVLAGRRGRSAASAVSRGAALPGGGALVVVAAVVAAAAAIGVLYVIQESRS